MPTLPDSAPPMLWALLIVAYVFVEVWKHRSVRAHGRDITEIKHQVKNSHDTNLREDLDDLRESVGEMRKDVRGMRKDVGELRGNDREQQTSFNEFRAHVREFARRNHPDDDL